MNIVQNYVLFISFWTLVHSSPFDDGKYKPRQYGLYDDGKYYRPVGEGKYVPGDEGKYNYIYKQGLYPGDDGDYRYIHETGPDGGDGPDGPGFSDGSNKIGYIGHRIYAERYPYVYSVIKSLVDKYVSTETLFGDESQGSVNHYSKAYADNEVAVKCQYLSSEDQDLNNTEFTTQYPPRLHIEAGEKLGSYYSFKGTKVLSTVANSLTNKLKIQYEVFVRVVDEVTD